MSRYETRYDEKIMKHYFYDTELKEMVKFDDVRNYLDQQDKQIKELKLELKKELNEHEEFVKKSADKIKELEKELEVYKKALELAVEKVAEYSGDYWQESKDYIIQAREELEEKND